MKKFWFQLFGLVIIICGATFLAFNNKYLTAFTSRINKRPVPVASVKITSRKLKIVDGSGNVKAELNPELADTPEKRTKGLGYRPALATDSGMLFIHDKPQKYTYWMKGMEFAIDFIWISGDTIADIIPNALPPVAGQTDDTLERYAPTVAVDKVLETNAGFVVAKNIQKGDKIILENK